MEKDSRILVLGHKGLVGSAIVRQLSARGYRNLLLPVRKVMDLTQQNEVLKFFQEYNPEYIFLAAAKVGGIKANWNLPAEFIYSNLSIQTNVINAARQMGAKKLLFLGSSCIYPRIDRGELRESDLLSAKLEPTNEPYAIAKIAGIIMCQAYRRQYGCNFIAAMPTNLYGPGDNYNLDTAHVIPALIRKFHTAKELNLPEVELWGTGDAFREFLHVDDCADACLKLMLEYDQPEIINIGYGSDLPIRDLAMIIAHVTGYYGRRTFDGRLEGVHQKLLNSDRLFSRGWKPKIQLEDGLALTYNDFRTCLENGTLRQ